MEGGGVTIWNCKNFWNDRDSKPGPHHDFRAIFFVSQYRKISKGGPLCFRKFGVSKNFMHIRGYHDFPSKIFSLTVPKSFVGEPFCASENFRYGKKLWISRGVEGGGVTIRNCKVFWHDRDSNPGPTALEPCCPNLTAVIHFWIKRVGNFRLKKKEKRPYWMNNFSCILHIRRKITRGAAALRYFPSIVCKKWRPLS